MSRGEQSGCVTIESMKVLGIDYGTKRIGLALSDADGRIAFPHSVIEREGAHDKITTLMQDEGVEIIVCGNAKNLSGEDNAITKEVERFAEKLENMTDLHVVLQHEFFSSANAHEALFHSGFSTDELDAHAAAVILQRFLDEKNQ